MQRRKKTMENMENKKCIDKFSFVGMVTNRMDPGWDYVEQALAGEAVDPLVIQNVTIRGKYVIAPRGQDDGQVCSLDVLLDSKGAAVDHTAFVQAYNPDDYVITLTKANGKEVYGIIEHFVDETLADTMSAGEKKSIIEALAAEKVKEGIVTQEIADMAIQYMLANYVPEFTIIGAIKSWIPHEKAVTVPSPFYVDPFKEELHKAGKATTVAFILQLALLGYGIMLESARGLGKDILTKSVAFCLQVPVYDAIFSSDTSSEIADGKAMTDNTASEWLASKEAEETERKAQEGDMDALIKSNLMKARANSVSIVIDKSEFYKCLQDRGCMQIDEINCGDPNLITRIFNPLLDNHKKMYFQGLGELQAKRPFFVVATMNAGYTGTMEQNQSTNGRFMWKHLQYPKSLRDVIEASANAELKALAEEGILIDHVPVIKKEYLDIAEKLYNFLYAAAVSEKKSISDTALNVRGFSHALVLSTIFTTTSLKEGLISGIVDGIQNVKERNAVLGMVNEIVGA